MRCLAGLACALLTACTFSHGPGVLHLPPPPAPDATYWSEVEAAARAHAPPDRLTMSDIDVAPSVFGVEPFMPRGVVGASARVWPFPGSGVRHVVEAAPDGRRVDARTTRGFNLGINLPSYVYAATGVDASGLQGVDVGLGDLPLLPLWVDAERVRAEPGRPTRPTSSWSWNPFWASSTVDPDADAATTAFGVPLLYWGLDEVAPGRSLRYRQALWTLGPAWFTTHDEQRAYRGWTFLPIAAGGVGLLAWVSSVQESPDRSLVAHGPAGLVYLDHSTRIHADDWDPLLMRASPHEIDRFRERAVLAGALWIEQQAYDAHGRLLDSFYGPLLGTIGWGRGPDGETFVSLLWFLRVPL